METNQLESNYGPWMVITRKKNSNRAGHNRRPNNASQGKPFESKGKLNFLEPKIKGNEGRLTTIVDPKEMTDPTTGNMSTLAVENLQRVMYEADVNDMEVCQEALSSGNVVCTEKSQSATGMDGISNKTHQKT